MEPTYILRAFDNIVKQCSMSLYRKIRITSFEPVPSTNFVYKKNY